MGRSMISPLQNFMVRRSAEVGGFEPAKPPRPTLIPPLGGEGCGWGWQRHTLKVGVKCCDALAWKRSDTDKSVSAISNKKTVGLNKGTLRRGSTKEPRVDNKPTLMSQGIDKNLAHQARTLGALNACEFSARLRASRPGRRASLHIGAPATALSQEVSR